MWGKSKAGSQAAASSLRDEKLKSSIILNAIEDGVVLVDAQGVIKIFNPAAATITGWKADEAEGLDWRLVFKFVNAKGEVLADEDTVIAKATQAGQPLRDNKAVLRSRSGTLIASTFSISPLIDASKQLTGLVGIFRDVSVERQEENQRADFISTASHEMRTPVAAIEGYLSLALNPKVANLDAKARDYLEKAHQSTQHLGRLFQDLLTSAKAEDGRLTSHPHVVEIGGLLDQLINGLKFSAEKKGLYLEQLFTSVQSGASGTAQVRPLYYAMADPDRLEEVITNLFDNAVKYTETGKISVGLTGDDQVIQLFIRDTGHGIPPEDIPHLFQKFYRVDNSATRTTSGTGLGLFICRKIVELYQGRIWVESTFGQGSTFYINLPRISTQRAEQLLEEATAIGEVSTGAAAATPAPK